MPLSPIEDENQKCDRTDDLFGKVTPPLANSKYLNTKK
jgi:hypothetical protein